MTIDRAESEIKIKTHKTPGARDFWKRWRREKSTEVVSNPHELPLDELPDPVMPPEVRKEIRESAQEEAGVGSHAARTAKGMEKAEERTESAIKKAKAQSSGE